MSSVHSNVEHWRDDFERTAAIIGVEAAGLHAVAAAEVGALPPPPIGLPVIRFEVHSFLRMTKEDASGVIYLNENVEPAWSADAHWYRSDPDGLWQRVHSGFQGDEWGALAMAAGVDPESAMKCASYGVGQLMGWHWNTIGCESVRHMLGEAQEGPQAQFDQWGRFFQNEKDGILIESMNAHDWRGFANVYNGPGQVDYYGAALEKHYDTALQVLAQPVDDVKFEPAHLDTWEERQTALVTLGYDPGAIDGQPGPATSRAVKAFQTDVGLTPDGIWGAKTEKAVAEALAQ